MVICFIETFVLKLERRGLGADKRVAWVAHGASNIYNSSRSTHSRTCTHTHTQASVLPRYYPLSLLRALSKALTPPPTRRHRAVEISFCFLPPRAERRPPDKGNFTLFLGLHWTDTHCMCVSSRQPAHKGQMSYASGIQTADQFNMNILAEEYYQLI